LSLLQQHNIADLSTLRDGVAQRVAIVHEWFDTYAGSERVVEQILAIFPDADIFGIVDFMAPSERGFLGGRPVKTSFIQRLPFARRAFRLYLGLMPLAVEQFDLSGYDVVISSNHAVAKGVITGPDQLHVCYIHSPMRYAWDLQHQYLRQAKMTRGLKSMYVRWLLSRLRQWEIRSAAGVDVFVANSSYIARRVRKAYRREAEVIHPPVDIERFSLKLGKEDYYFVASRQVPYKRIDLIVAAFAKMPGRRLIVAGDGPERKRVMEAAAGASNVSMVGAVPQAELVRLMQGARACVVAAEEDFGISMVEVQACGTPLITFSRGGAADIIDAGGATGVLFHEQTVEAIIGAVEQFEARSGSITPEACRANALRFSERRFREQFADLVSREMRQRDAAARVEFLPERLAAE
jgi:glycosyltransferase involved in cell wall biosynthesis